MLTSEQFKSCFPANPTPSEWAGALNSILPGYAIDTPLRLSAFLAQCGHESEGFTALVENLNYSAQALANTWPNRYAVDPKAKMKEPNALALRLHRKPEAIANNVYANRMGNGPEESGDGWRFRGRSPIQGTGKNTYLAFAKRTGRTLQEALDYAETKAGGLELSCMFWDDHKLNPLADAGKMTAITKIINGGVNGLEDRIARYERIKKVLCG